MGWAPSHTARSAAAADITLSADVLDRIDKLTTPGVTANPDDNSYGAHELTAQARRRKQS